MALLLKLQESKYCCGSLLGAQASTVRSSNFPVNKQYHRKGKQHSRKRLLRVCAGADWLQGLESAHDFVSDPWKLYGTAAATLTIVGGALLGIQLVLWDYAVRKSDDRGRPYDFHVPSLFRPYIYTGYIKYFITNLDFENADIEEFSEGVTSQNLLGKLATLVISKFLRQWHALALCAVLQCAFEAAVSEEQELRLTFGLLISTFQHKHRFADLRAPLADLLVTPEILESITLEWVDHFLACKRGYTWLQSFKFHLEMWLPEEQEQQST